MSTEPATRRSRVARPDDIDAIVEVLTSAFFRDPLWGPVFDDDTRALDAAVMWRVFATSALRYPWTFVTQGREAVAIWIPPGETELTAEEDEGFTGVLERAAGVDSAQSIMRIYEQLDAAHPAEPYFYLSLLGVHDDYRGLGLGMALLEDTLTHIDALGSPAYLESSNPANNARYEAVGFRERAQLEMESGHLVTTMWREARTLEPERALRRGRRVGDPPRLRDR